ncbi:MAG: hypothetical protein ACHQIO_18010 [Nevskiales bacterium]
MILDIVMLALTLAACIGAAAYARACDRLVEIDQPSEPSGQ